MNFFSRSKSVFGWFILCFCATGIWSQDAQTADAFVPLSELKPLEVTGEYKEKHSFQYGLSASNTYLTDKGSLSKGLWLGNYRPYVRYMLNEQHIFNLRGKFSYRHNPNNTGKQAGQVTSTWEYAAELFNAELHFDRHQVTVGRQFYRMGRGLLLANFADGAEYNGTFKYLQVKALALYSGQYSGCVISVGGCATQGDIAQKGPYDIVPGRAADVNIPDPGRRLFAGLQLQSPQLWGSSLTGLALYSRDLSRDAATTGSSTKDKIYAFDPLYLGGGLSGYIITPRLYYLSEFVYEMGKTYNAKTSGGANQQTDIRAWGLTADLTYTLPVLESLIKPALLLQYATGSGREGVDQTPKKPSEVNISSNSDPAQANSSGYDNNFYYFGAYSAGLALKPKIANLHIIRAGAQFRPLYYFYWGRNMMLSLKYSYYLKQNKDYGISDQDAKAKNAYVGWAIDTQLVWDFRSDLKLYYAFGYFKPGDAYAVAKETALQTHIVSLNLLF